ncbi:MAG TPA: phosphopeptide-binding protein [Cyanobacteria bacterium UBA11149]|nr:phosphopeptide-binding protein [Cyanobacteria bacterium UBA11367]HBR74618.1 phosphopeptide-binding protein [Cyanobacteria bacterium UBA11159]HBW91029.1 phosphopeptide-binding protein [Cyanobacteria bacterium UBA11149]HCA97318.1 phosphopeptide-binding protein [Cyanobacteria bacterium UBA9226]
MEIEQRLGLYQIFLKVYQYHRSLLDEILQLEKTGHKTFASRTIHYVTGVMQGEKPYLVTNLAGGKTKILLQPQGVWSIGRDRKLAISIPDPHLSRYHAVIQYIPNRGFSLVDLRSTNGSFLNGEPVYGRMRLKDGDRIRLGNLAFSFFISQDTQVLDQVPSAILNKLQEATVASKMTTPSVLPSSGKESNLDSLPIHKLTDSRLGTSRFLDLPEFEAAVPDFAIPELDSVARGQILDRFFSLQSQKVSP